MFIGYPRSSHSLVGAILDAHPEIIIPFEYDVMTNWEKYQSARLKQKNMQKYQLFFDLHKLSLEQAMFGIYASANRTLLKKNQYTYHVPGLWQGGYEQRIKVSKLESSISENLRIKSKHGMERHPGLRNILSLSFIICSPSHKIDYGLPYQESL